MNRGSFFPAPLTREGVSFAVIMETTCLSMGENPKLTALRLAFVINVQNVQYNCNAPFLCVKFNVGDLNDIVAHGHANGGFPSRKTWQSEADRLLIDWSFRFFLACNHDRRGNLQPS
jgi:hypothetical protein